MKNIKFFAALIMAGALASCSGNGSTNVEANVQDSTKTTVAMEKKAPFTKKYTNADFYTDGKFNEDVAKKAYLEMLEYYGVPYSDFLKENLWVAEFGTGDFENVGMAGVFWVNDADHGYFAHEIYLLPGQMIPEHKHVKTKFPAKFESWRVTKGWCYNFSEVGDATPDAPAIPATQKDMVISKNFVRQGVDQVVPLKKSETWHFLMAGDEGAIVAEYATYHDGDGLRFSNSKAKL